MMVGATSITHGWMFAPSAVPLLSVGAIPAASKTLRDCTSHPLRQPAPSAPFPAPRARACLFSRLDGVSRRRPSDSNRTSQARCAPPSPRFPTRKRRRRRWATPKNCASRTRHARPYPSSSMLLSRHPKSSPCVLESAPGTFSQSTHRGRSSRTARTNSHMSPDAPSRPVLVPAMEKDWQGLPPATTSTAPTYGSQSIFVTSPRFGTSGNLSASTAQGKGSSSEKSTGRMSSPRHATDTASIPLKSETYLMPSPPVGGLPELTAPPTCHRRPLPRPASPCSSASR